MRILLVLLVACSVAHARSETLTYCDLCGKQGEVSEFTVSCSSDVAIPGWFDEPMYRKETRTRTLDLCPKCGESVLKKLGIGWEDMKVEVREPERPLYLNPFNNWQGTIVPN